MQEQLVEKLEETGKNLPKRNEKGQLLPGNASLNPNGRPEGTVSIVEALRRKLKEFPPGEERTYLEIFIEQVYKKTNEEGDVSMMKDLIDRIDGKPDQHLTADVNERRILLD